METFIDVLVMLAATAASGAAVRFVPIPLPLIQILLGALLAWPIGMHVRLEPELFLVLFIPPLLFFDGWRIPKREFNRDIKPILTLAFGLVIFTVVGAGYLIHWLIPALPLPVAFALAAALSPTDAVAVAGITGRIRMPPRLMHILEGEALLNDASGLVAMRVAVAAALTGHFSFVQASGSFFIVAVGGLAVGVATAWLLERVIRILTRSTHDTASAQILMTLLIPFAAYLVAEHATFSGILAASAAGIFMSYQELRTATPGSVRTQGAALLGMLQFTLNGVIFVLLGLQIPTIMVQAPEISRAVGLESSWELFGITAIITLALIGIRFVWVWMSMLVTLYRRRGVATSRPPLKVVVASAFAGVRGAVTLAAILTLPFVMSDGSSFPGRNLAIFIAASVILASLLLASLSLPLLLKDLELPADAPAVEEEKAARVGIAEAAVGRLEKLGERGDRNAEALASVMALYRERLDDEADVAEADQERERLAAEREIRLVALQAELRQLYRLRRENRIGDEVFRKLQRELDQTESSIRTRAASAH
ncbi:sodium/proton antiporter, CPA1 family [Faunimonas pinastri]|uniref:Sodium/proton antiporter, CPA1 family n=1 Tax=Faunimonas pinastri TaxID=1855383 RepID=A0A1H9PXT6_9HYPH|nr:Na+/H+ antiporter [Faunimonas pinastri]SER52938.1 sodium/proton antiporter, CPA1 family [Faunimonas pinastri]